MVSLIIYLLGLLMVGLVAGVFVMALNELEQIEEISDPTLPGTEVHSASPFSITVFPQK